MHFLRLLAVWWPGAQSARDNYLLACNFTKYSSILSSFFTAKLSNKSALIRFWHTMYSENGRQISSKMANSVERKGDRQCLIENYESTMKFLFYFFQCTFMVKLCTLERICRKLVSGESYFKTASSVIFDVVVVKTKQSCVLSSTRVFITRVSSVGVQQAKSTSSVLLCCRHRLPSGKLGGPLDAVLVN